MAAFGILNPKSEVSAKYITEYVFSQLGAESEEEIATLLENVAVQEALLQVQKAYVANPTEWLRDMLADAFRDVVKTSAIQYLVLGGSGCLEMLGEYAKRSFTSLSLSFDCAIF